MSDKGCDNPPEPPRLEMIVYQTADGRTRVECRFAGELIAEPKAADQALAEVAS